MWDEGGMGWGGMWWAWDGGGMRMEDGMKWDGIGWEGRGGIGWDGRGGNNDKDEDVMKL